MIVWDCCCRGVGVLVGISVGILVGVGVGTLVGVGIGVFVGCCCIKVVGVGVASGQTSSAPNEFMPSFVIRYSPLTQSSERLVFEIRTSSMLPVNQFRKLARLPNISGSEFIVVVVVVSLTEQYCAPFIYIVMVEPDFIAAT